MLNELQPAAGAAGGKSSPEAKKNPSSTLGSAFCPRPASTACLLISSYSFFAIFPLLPLLRPLHSAASSFGTCLKLSSSSPSSTSPLRLLLPSSLFSSPAPRPPLLLFSSFPLLRLLSSFLVCSCSPLRTRKEKKKGPAGRCGVWGGASGLKRLPR